MNQALMKMSVRTMRTVKSVKKIFIKTVKKTEVEKIVRMQK